MSKVIYHLRLEAEDSFLDRGPAGGLAEVVASDVEVAQAVLAVAAIAVVVAVAAAGVAVDPAMVEQDQDFLGQEGLPLYLQTSCLDRDRLQVEQVGSHHHEVAIR